MEEKKKNLLDGEVTDRPRQMAEREKKEAEREEEEG